jgi:hypothetical protein
VRGFISISARRLVSLTVCFALLLVLIVGSVSASDTFSSSSSPYHLLTKSFADDMMGGPTSGGSSDSGGSEGGDHDEGAESGDGGGGSREEAESGDGGGGSRGDGKEGDNNQKKQASNENPKAASLGGCDLGEEHDIFTNECKPTVLAQNPANTGPATPTTPTPTTCLVSYNPEESDQSSVWGSNNEQLIKMHSGILYYTLDDRGIQQQQLSLFHQMQGMQLGKTYDLSSYSGSECNINQVRNKDGSITATITFPNHVKQVIRTDTTGKVPIQINHLDYDNKIFVSEAVDNDGIATKVNQDVGGLGESGLTGIETTEPGGTKPIISVVLDSKDGSLKILGRGAIGQSSVGRHELQDDNDGDPTIATTKSGMKVTVTPFNVAYPNPGASKDDPLATMSSDHSVVRVINPDSSIKTHMIINPDGSVQPGSKWLKPPTEATPADPVSQ